MAALLILLITVLGYFDTFLYFIDAFVQGYARLSSPGTRFANAGESQNLGWEKDMKRTGQELSAYFSLEWLSKTPVHIEAPWTENPEVSINCFITFLSYYLL